MKMMLPRKRLAGNVAGPNHRDFFATRPQLVRVLLSALIFVCAATPAGADTFPVRVSFRHDVEAVLSKAGCNAGTCHGSPTGKNGFRLSLRGYDPEFD